MPALPPADPAGVCGAGVDRFDDLRAWLMEPQRSWLRGLGLRPGEAEAAVEDLEPLALEERQRVRLLAGVLDHDLLEEAARLGWPFWTGRERGRGTLPAAAGGELEARLLQGRLVSLAAGLAGLGPERGGPLSWQGWQASPVRRGDAVVLVHGGAVGVARAMDLWLQLLLTAAAGEAPGRGVLFCRSSRDRTVFGPELALAAPAAAAAAAELDRLAELRAAWRGACWPLPPRTAWAWLKAERQRVGTGLAAARAAWEGRPGAFAERERAEMLLCFGDAPPLEALLDDSFGERAVHLYGPLLEARQ
jgi:exodeoxyribonuclease V gamma subunit